MTGQGTEDRPPVRRPHDGILSPRLVAAVVIVVLLLLIVVVTVGLLQRTLDPTGVAIALSTMFSGIVVGALVRRDGGGPK